MPHLKMAIIKNLKLTNIGKDVETKKLSKHC